MARKRRLFLVFAALIVLTTIKPILCMAHPQHAISDKLAVRAIIGEASGEGYRGMLAVAGAIRNRGTLRGVYGLNAPHVCKQPRWVWTLARRAWKESATKDIVNGARYWESVHFKKPYWSRNMCIAARIKAHIFYN